MKQSLEHLTKLNSYQKLYADFLKKAMNEGLEYYWVAADLSKAIYILKKIVNHDYPNDKTYQELLDDLAYLEEKHKGAW